MDLTVPNAVAVKDFYAKVVGWKAEPLDVGGYDDFIMTGEAGGDGVSTFGVCHARGTNADLPPTWLIYITVADLDAAVAKVTKLGGKVRRAAGAASAMGRFAVVEDPAGATVALFEAPVVVKKTKKKMKKPAKTKKPAKSSKRA